MFKPVLIGHNQSSGHPLSSGQQHKSNFPLAFTAKTYLYSTDSLYDPFLGNELPHIFGNGI